MAVKGPNGPRSGTNAIQNGENPAEKAAESKKTQLKAQQPSSDEFDRIAESLAGSDTGREQQQKTRRKAAKRKQSALWSRATDQRAQNTEKLQHKAEQLLHLMALQGFTLESIERHRKELAKIRKELERIQKKKIHESRNLKAEDYEQVSTPDIQKLEKELARIEAIDSPLEKAYEAASLILTEDLATEQRRVKLAPQDMAAGLSLAATTNPSTVLLDLASSENEDPQHDLTEPQDNPNLDRSLTVLQRLQDLINYGDRLG
ncbi:MAG: hypothetical protein VYC39_10550 [Myxococcota bacterium]|nr:hypothetical protein [Myxococcota bacterium]